MAVYNIVRDGPPGEVSISFDPDPYGTRDSPQTTAFFFSTIGGNVTVTAPAVDPDGWVWDGWWFGGERQTAEKDFLIIYGAPNESTWTATYTVSEEAAATPVYLLISGGQALGGV